MQENLSSGFPTKSYTNRSVQPQTKTSGLKFRDCVHVAKTKTLIAKLTCAFVFSCAKYMFSHDAAHMPILVIHHLVSLVIKYNKHVVGVSDHVRHKPDYIG